MNVAFDPWIPVVNTSGNRELVSLHTILVEGDKYADLAVRPHERVALMRLLLCVAHAALDGPKNYDEWKKVPQRLPVSARKYLEEWRDSFELFHPSKPWLQVAGLSKSKTSNTSAVDTDNWTPASKLNFSLATGSNSTLFDHEGMVSSGRNILLCETIVSMVTFQCFSVGGLIGQVFWDGTRCGELANSKKENGPVKSADAPCVPSSMIHALLRGDSLLGTIHLNLITRDDIKFSYGDRDFGKPLWEMMPRSLADAIGVENATATFVGRLVPLTRVIRLHSSGNRMLIGNGLTYPSFLTGFPQEPSATVTIINDERALLSYRPSKAIWRELTAVTAKRRAEGTGGPLSLRAIQDGGGYDLVIAALARDKATIVDTIESVFRIPALLSTSDGTIAYESEVKYAENLARYLGWATEDYRKEIDSGWEGRLKASGSKKGELRAKLHSVAATHYWTTVEKKLSLLMSHISAIGTDNTVPARTVWRKMLQSAALEAYSLSCGQETPRHIRAYAKGLQKLTVNKQSTKKSKEVVL